MMRSGANRGGIISNLEVNGTVNVLTCVKKKEVSFHSDQFESISQDFNFFFFLMSRDTSR